MITNLVGNRIREMRARRKLTQQRLADLAGIPRATLATIERDDANPSLAAVYRVAIALDCTIDDLLEKHNTRVESLPREAMGKTESGDGAYRALTISPPSKPHLQQQLFSLQPNSIFDGKPHPPGSEEYLHIIEGEVVLTVAGEKVHLRSGDSAYFRGNIQHSYQNPGSQQARGIVTILVFPDFQ